MTRHIAHYPGQYVHPLLAKTATGEMSEADLTPDGEWGFIVDVAEDLGGTIHPFDKYQGPYIMYKGNQFWFVTEGQDDYIYNETTGEMRPFSVWQNPSYAANEIREMVGERYASRKRSSRKTALDFDFGDLTTIDPNTGRFYPVHSLDPSQKKRGNPKYLGYNILELVEEFLANEVSFTPTVSYQEPTTVIVSCAETGWSASVDASKEGWGLRLLEKAEAYDDDYMGKWLDENSDFSGYRASRKTAYSGWADKPHWFYRADFAVWARDEQHARSIWANFINSAPDSIQLESESGPSEV